MLPLLLLALAIGGGAGYYAALRFTTPCPLDRTSCVRFAAFWRAWDLATANYVDPKAVDPVKMTDGAIEGMLDSLGDEGHTRYLSAATAKREQESLAGRFEGIGAYVSKRNGQIILQPIEGAPADRAGVRAGDVLLRVDGQAVDAQEVGDVTPRVRGPKGTNVTLTVRHAGDELPSEIMVTRDEIKVPAVTWKLLPGQVADIQLTQFSQPAPDELRQALMAAQAQGARSIVLDLRNNPGGLLSALTAIAAEFLPANSTVLIEQSRDGTRKPYTTEKAGSAQSIPLVVLVNNYTASSAEILAGALKEAGRAQVVGVPTFGTATVLRPFDLGDGAQLRLGTTQWLTPNGEEVRGKGIEPNVLVALGADVRALSPSDAAALSEDQLLNGKDTQLAKALTLLAR